MSRWLSVLLIALAGCDGEPKQAASMAPSAMPEAFDPAMLPPPETFTWGSQPISVSPPPDGWNRQRAQSGGLRGVRFIKSRSFGEEIRIAEHYALDDRLRCSEQMELLENLDRFDRNEFARAVQRAKFYLADPINSFEQRSAETANQYLDEAREAFLAGDISGARRAVRRAIDQGRSIRYALDDVIDRVMFDAASYDSFGRVETLGRKSGYVGGVPSVSIDYTLDSHDNGHLYHGRQIYVLEDNRLFVLTFHGLRQNLPVFEAIVESVSFPRSLCTA